MDLDLVELAGVPSLPMSLCVNSFSLASSPGLFLRGWEKLKAINDYGPLVTALFVCNSGRLFSYRESNVVCFLSFGNLFALTNLRCDTLHDAGC